MVVLLNYAEFGGPVQAVLDRQSWVQVWCFNDQAAHKPCFQNECQATQKGHELLWYLDLYRYWPISQGKSQ